MNKFFSYIFVRVYYRGTDVFGKHLSRRSVSRHDSLTSSYLAPTAIMTDFKFHLYRVKMYLVHC